MSHLPEPPEGYLILRRAIPRGEAKVVADKMPARLGGTKPLGADAVRKWRQPVVERSGEPSCMDRQFQLMRALFEVNRDGYDVLMGAIQDYDAALRATEDANKESAVERKLRAMELMIAQFREMKS